ncbi:MAG: DUF1887 family protein [Chloroflexi bacterium]|nr:DUF1887 family protein [Chloroflexota bacterium]
MALPSTLLCLVSEQRMQNAIPLFQTGLHFDQVVLVASKDNGVTNPRFARIAQDLECAFGERARWILWNHPVDPMDPGSTAGVCTQIIDAFGGPDCVTVNFTGGTKPMSIGAYQAGLAGGAPLLYVDTQKEQLYLYQRGAPHSEPFHLEPMTVGQILAAHGKAVNANWTLTRQPSAVERSITEQIYTQRPGSLLQALSMQNLLRRQALDANQEKQIDQAAVEPAAWLAGWLQQAGEARIENDQIKISHCMARYLDGAWLEQYVGLALESDGRFADVAGNLQLAGIENELDVACTLNGKLAIVECKSGKMEKGEGAAVISRLRTLKESLAGTFGKSFLVNCYYTHQLSSRFVERAAEYVSRMICLEDLAEVENIIYNEIAMRRR